MPAAAPKNAASSSSSRPPRRRRSPATSAPDYVVESSIGHIRDLPKRAADDPGGEQEGALGALGVDVDNDFEPFYVVDADKKKVVAELQAAAQGRGRAPARDGRGPRGRGDRLAPARGAEAEGAGAPDGLPRDHQEAIQRALEHTRAIDERLVDAQETRRILDRLYGYEVSPVLWKKVMRGLSAGRVQSVATRLVVQRERERMAFVVAGYWDIEATFDPGAFDARLVAVDGRRVAQGRDFGADGKLRAGRRRARRGRGRAALAAALDGQPFTVRSVEREAVHAAGRRRRS